MLLWKLQKKFKPLSHCGITPPIVVITFLQAIIDYRLPSHLSTFNATEAQLIATSQNPAIINSQREALPLPARGQEAFQALEQRLIDLVDKNLVSTSGKIRSFLKLEKTKAEMNRRIDNSLRSKPNTSLEDISSCISKFEMRSPKIDST